MKKIFSILLSLALLVSLGALTTAPVMAVVTAPTISPTSANFNESNPTQISVTVNWGDATSLTTVQAAGSASPLNPVLNTDYFVYDTLVVFTSSYLQTSLPDIGDTLILVLTFDVGAAILTITATGTGPSINPTSRTWVLGSGASVNTTITWGTVNNSVVDIEDDDGDPLATPADYTVSGNYQGTANLTITNAYLAAELLVVGASTKLTIDFGQGNDATFTITCAAAPVPSVSPATLTYNLGTSSNVSTNIEWGNATAISKIIDMSSISNPVTLVASTDYWVVGDTLILRGTCSMSGWGGLECRLDASSRTTRVLEITFNNAAATKVNLLVNSGGFTNPSLSSTALTYDLNRANDPTYLYVVALITFGTATNITRVDVNNATGAYFGNSYPAGCNRTLAPGSYLVSADYYTAYVGAYASNAILFWKDTFLKQACNATSAGANLTKLGDAITLTIYWQPWNPVYSTGTYYPVGTGTCPIDPYVYGYPHRYSPTSVTITAVGTGASISPVKADFNLDAPANATTTITFGPYATSVTKVMNGINQLTNGVDYTVSGTTLNIASSYLSALGMAVDDQVVLTVVFDQGADAKFTITAIGTPLCVIATAVGEDEASLDILRAFRDNVLRGNALGRAFIRAYYTVSPSIAPVIAKNAALKAAVKWGVDLIVGILS